MTDAATYEQLVAGVSHALAVSHELRSARRARRSDPVQPVATDGGTLRDQFLASIVDEDRRRLEARLTDPLQIHLSEFDPSDWGGESR